MATTNKEILELVEELKSKMPNGNIALLQKSVEDLKTNQDFAPRKLSRSVQDEI